LKPPKIGQRWLFKDGRRSFVLEIKDEKPIKYKVVQVIKETELVLGTEVTYCGSSFESRYFSLLEGQDTPNGN
jgi:hypothetical protein